MFQSKTAWHASVSELRQMIREAPIRDTIDEFPRSILHSGAVVKIHATGHYKRTRSPIIFRVDYDPEAHACHPSCEEDESSVSAGLLTASTNYSSVFARVAGASGSGTRSWSSALRLRALDHVRDVLPLPSSVIVNAKPTSLLHAACTGPFAFFRSKLAPSTSPSAKLTRVLADEHLVPCAYRKGGTIVWHPYNPAVDATCFAVRIDGDAAAGSSGPAVGGAGAGSGASAGSSLRARALSEVGGGRASDSVVGQPLQSGGQYLLLLSLLKGAGYRALAVPDDADVLRGHVRLHNVPVSEGAALPRSAVWTPTAIPVMTRGGAASVAYVWRTRSSDDADAVEYIFDGSAVNRSGEPLPAFTLAELPRPLYNPSTLRLQAEGEWTPKVRPHAYRVEDSKKLKSLALALADVEAGGTPDQRFSRLLRAAEIAYPKFAAIADDLASPYAAFLFDKQPIIFIGMRAAAGAAARIADRHKSRSSAASASLVGAAAAAPPEAGGASGGAGAAAAAAPPAASSPPDEPSSHLPVPCEPYSLSAATEFAFDLLLPLVDAGDINDMFIMLQADEAEDAAPFGYCYRSLRWGEPMETAGRGLRLTDVAPGGMPERWDPSFPRGIAFFVGAIQLMPETALMCVPPEIRVDRLETWAQGALTLSMGGFSSSFIT